MVMVVVVVVMVDRLTLARMLVMQVRGVMGVHMVTV